MKQTKTLPKKKIKAVEKLIQDQWITFCPEQNFRTEIINKINEIIDLTTPTSQSKGSKKKSK